MSERRTVCSGCRPLFRYMRNDLARLKIRCKNHRLGCDHVSSLEFAQAHEDECPLEEVQCRHGCGARLPRADMSEHMEECEAARRREEAGSKECSNGCGLVIITRDDREHNCIAELRTSIEVSQSASPGRSTRQSLPQSASETHGLAY